MCGGGGSKPPARELTPTERYSTQIGDFQRLMNQRNNQRAQDYNQRVSAFRNQASEAERKFNALNQTLRGLNLRDANATFDWNNGALTRSQNGRALRDIYSDVESRFNDLRTQFDALQAERPNFTSSVNGFSFRGMGGSSTGGSTGGGNRGGFNVNYPGAGELDFGGGNIGSGGAGGGGSFGGGGPTLGDNDLLDYGFGDTVFVNAPVSFSMPTLQSLPDFSRFTGQLQNLWGGITDLENRYQTESSRLNQARNDFGLGVEDLRNQIGSLTIRDDAQARAMQRQLSQLRGQVTGFQTPLDFDRNELLQQLDALNAIDEADNFTSIPELMAKRQAELNRINEFRTGLGGRLGELGTELSRLGLGRLNISTDPTALLGNLDSLEGSLAGIQDQFGNFQSELDTDFTREMERFAKLQSDIAAGRNRIGQINSVREAEFGRISAKEQEIRDAISALQDQANYTGIADERAINNLQRQLDQLMQGASNFTSPLSYDFADDLAGTGQVQAAIAALRQRREQEVARTGGLLNQATADIDSIIAQLNSLNPNISIADEQGIAGLGTTIEQLRSRLEGEVNDLGSIQTDLNLNTTPQQRALQRAQQLLDRLGTQQQTLSSRRQAELDRLTAIEDSLNGDLFTAKATLDSLGLGDANQARQIIAEAKRRIAMLDGLQSELGLDRFSDERNLLNELLTGGQSLLDRRTQEDNRIRSFREQQLADIQGLAERVRNANIGNEEELKALEQALGREFSDFQGFMSELNPDFSREDALLQQAMAGLGNLQNRRQAEVDRLENARADFQDRVAQLTSGLSSADIYDGSLLNRSGADIQTLRSQLEAFQTPLQFDRTSLLAALQQAEGTLGQRRQQRDAAISTLGQQVGDAVGGLGALAETDETGFRDARSNLSDLMGYLNTFSGGGTESILNNLRSGMTTADSRLRNITTTRSNIEREAQALSDALKEMNFWNSDLLGPQRQRLDALRGRVDQWSALQAQDELAAIESRLQGETNRLQKDAEAVTRRNALGRAQVFSAFDPYGNLTFAGQRAISPATLDTIQAQVNSMSQDDLERLMSQQDLRTFANNLGILRV